MREKREQWQVAVVWLRGRGWIGHVGVKCNGRGHQRSWHR